MNDRQKFIQKHWLDIKSAQQYSLRLLVFNRDSYKILGSAVGIKIDENYFILTAAHVIIDEDDFLIPIGTNEMLRPGGKIIFTDIRESAENDKIDIAIMKLDEITVDELKPHYKFLEKKNLFIHSENPTPLFYTFLGYPKSYSRYSYSRESFHSNIFFHFTTPLPTNEYMSYGRNPDTNILVKYDKKRCINTKSKLISSGPDLYGMSGCGLWLTDPNEIYDEKSEPKLAAILTEWPIKNRSIVIGTKTQYIVEVIKKQFEL